VAENRITTTALAVYLHGDKKPLKRLESLTRGYTQLKQGVNESIKRR